MRPLFTKRLVAPKIGAIDAGTSAMLPGMSWCRSPTCGGVVDERGRVLQVWRDPFSGAAARRAAAAGGIERPASAPAGDVPPAIASASGTELLVNDGDHRVEAQRQIGRRTVDTIVFFDRREHWDSFWPSWATAAPRRRGSKMTTLPDAVARWAVAHRRAPRPRS